MRPPAVAAPHGWRHETEAPWPAGRPHPAAPNEATILGVVPRVPAVAVATAARTPRRRPRTNPAAASPNDPSRARRPRTNPAAPNEATIVAVLPVLLSGAIVGEAVDPPDGPIGRIGPTLPAGTIARRVVRPGDRV